MRQKLATNAAALAVLLALGCGQQGERTYPVSGKLVWSDGQSATELRGATVELRNLNAASRSVSPNGEVQADGSFKLRSYSANDGAPAGDYQVMVMPQKPQSAEAPGDVFVMQRRFESYESSQLRITVEPKSNFVKLTLLRFR